MPRAGNTLSIRLFQVQLWPDRTDIAKAATYGRKGQRDDIAVKRDLDGRYLGSAMRTITMIGLKAQMLYDIFHHLAGVSGTFRRSDSSFSSSSSVITINLPRAPSSSSSSSTDLRADKGTLEIRPG